MVCCSASEDSARKASRASATTVARSSPAWRTSASSVSSCVARLRATSQAQAPPIARPSMRATMTIGPTNGRDRVGQHRNPYRSNRYDPPPMARKDRAPTLPSARRHRSGVRRRPIAAAKARQRRLLAYRRLGVAAARDRARDHLLHRAAAQSARALEDAGCTLQSFPALPNKSDHSDVPTLTTKPKWNSNPPTSGPHYGEWAIWGSYGASRSARAEHAQPRARRRRDPLRPRRSRGRGRQAPHLVQRRPERADHRAAGHQRRQDHALRLDGPGRHHRHERPRQRLARDLQDVQRGRGLGLPRRTPLPGPRAGPAART